VRRDWDRLPEGRGPNTSREWFGGDLPGIERRLDHIVDLGANVIYLTPFFPAGSTHRYDASSFDRVDALLGGDDALASLVRAAHGRGVKLVGDLTMNHCGVTHDWFERAASDRSSPERKFFYFDESFLHGYATWVGVRTLPTLDWRSEELQSRMHAILRRWLDAGLDGWRIDVANMVGRHRDIDLNHHVAAWTRKIVDGSLLLAEHGHDFRPDLDGTGWHGTMNYAGFLRPAWWWLRGDHVTEDVFSSAPSPRYSGIEMTSVMSAFRAGVPWGATLNSWTLLDSHDTARFRSVAASPAHHLVGLGLQFTTPGVPMLFAGDEIGLEGDWGEDARRTMPWDSPDTWDRALLETTRQLAALRRSSDALSRGGIRYLHVSDDAVAYVRETRSERLLCLAARASHDPITAPYAELETLYGSDALDGALPAEGPAFHIWRIHG
jgi:alpha-glucosidase